MHSVALRVSDVAYSCSVSSRAKRTRYFRRNALGNHEIFVFAGTIRNLRSVKLTATSSSTIRVATLLTAVRFRQWKVAVSQIIEITGCSVSFAAPRKLLDIHFRSLRDLSSRNVQMLIILRSYPEPLRAILDGWITLWLDYREIKKRSSRVNYGPRYLILSRALNSRDRICLNER